MKVADAVWVATAHLHQEHPEAADFPNSVLIARTLAEGRTDAKPITVQAHVFRHMVANLEPQPAKLRMLQETTKGRRRLHGPDDPYHPNRRGGPDEVGKRMAPRAEDLPVELRPLLDWYAQRQRAANGGPPHDQLLALAGSARGVWAGEAPDDYVRRLREPW
ncbi:MAG TPA: hypothetical protein VGL99_19035 [Chloroflexota bacterium]